MYAESIHDDTENNLEETTEETTEETIYEIIQPNKECRICFENYETVDNELIYPCYCSGTSKYVHRECLEKWREANVDNDAYRRCRECHARYKIKYKNIVEYYFFSNETIDYFFKYSNIVTINAIMFFFGSTVRIFDNYTDYTFLKNVYFIKPSGHFINTIKKDTLYSIAFYYSYLIFSLSLLFHFLFMYIVNLSIFNPIQY